MADAILKAESFIDLLDEFGSVSQNKNTSDNLVFLPKTADVFYEELNSRVFPVPVGIWKRTVRQDSQAR